MTTTPRTVEIPAGPVIPAGTETLLRKVPVQGRHPGLQLDKFSSGGTQKEHQGRAVQEACKAKGDPDTLAWAIERRAPLLTGATTFRARTGGPFTLHLSRASALENAGICLHPLYGFACLPGSGLKGMARAWAETTGVSQEDIRAVFGWVPNGRQLKDGCIGAVVFHDAWPTEWPTLIPDIVNNHHPQYYQGSEPPGDWMDPVPVQFLAVAPGTTFLFAVGPRVEDTDPTLVAKAVEWLTHALALRGAGAKTNAGYGTFVPVDGPRPTPDPDLSFTVTLELTSPAFLAGATQDGADCDLRPATLRGLLRWWWRTLHAASVDCRLLRAMEASIWGDTSDGSPVRIALESVRQGSQEYAFKQLSHKDGETKLEFFPKEEILKQHDLQRPQDRTITQGLFYMSYGMEEVIRNDDQKEIRRRHFSDSLSAWKLIVSFNSGNYYFPGEAKKKHRQTLCANEIQKQVEIALWMLIHFGGVGSKSRKGFGSFVDCQIGDIRCLSDCQKYARDFRAACGISSSEVCDSPAIGEHPEIMQDVETPWKDPWFVLDRLGFAYQKFAQSLKHDANKTGLGLPRKIHGPRTLREGGALPHQESYREPVWLGDGHKYLSGLDYSKVRDASPIHFSMSRTATGNIVVRAIAVPASYHSINGTPPDLFGMCLTDVRRSLEADISNPRFRALGQRVPSVPAKAGDLVKGQTCIVVLEAPKKNRISWKGRHEASGREGAIHGFEKIPPEKLQEGNRLTVRVRFVSVGDTGFEWLGGED